MAWDFQLDPGMPHEPPVWLLHEDCVAGSLAEGPGSLVPDTFGRRLGSLPSQVVNEVQWATGGAQNPKNHHRPSSKDSF